MTKTLYETTGGVFDEGAPTPSTVPVGMATATFTSCSALKLAFNVTGGSSSEASEIINMTPCRSNAEQLRTLIRTGDGNVRHPQ